MTNNATTWTAASIAAHRATGDALVTRDGWSVSFDTSSEYSGSRFSCIKYGPGMSLVVLERDARDGEMFETTEEAECYALNAGRLRWFSEYKAERDRAANSITDAQIRDLYARGAIDCYTRDIAIRTYRGGMGDTWRRQTRAQCAAILAAQEVA